jgi:hypothetical protein
LPRRCFRQCGISSADTSNGRPAGEVRT